MSTTIKYPPSTNAVQKTLDAQLLSGVTAAVTLNNVTGIQDKEGICVIDAVDANGTATPAKREYIKFTGVSGSTLTGLTRNADGGSSDQDHAVGAIVQFGPDVLQQQSIIDSLLTEHNEDGTHKSATVTTLKATGAVVNTGTSDVTIVTPKALADSDYAKTSDITVTADSTATFTNKDLTSPTNTFGNNVYSNSLAYQCIINGGFTVNQRVYISNATLAAGAYGHDRWKAGASGGDYTFTQLAQATTITIKSGKSLIQVIEDKNVIGGTYTLSWTGTAQARFGINSATPSGAYAASPITITTQTAGTVMSVEFNEGTLGQVSLANSSVALPFMPKSFEEELRACQRYCYQVGSDNSYTTYGIGLNESTTVCSIPVTLPVSMRINPTLETTGTATNYRVGITNCSSVPAIADTTQNKNIVYVGFTIASGLTAGQVQKLQNNGTAAYLRFIAEL